MAIAATNMSSSSNNNNSDRNKEGEEEDDDHEHDMVMPGFRFHPTEEELVEFYLRRKVEGKRFNVQLITFLDLYRYDPWELPAMAAIGEKEWFFYVPRDRKYRNGDRPNRVTTSGYWKATGADRMIRTENNSRSIGLKKTLVFYSGKAPKGIRTSWIMNEYRLPHHETERYQKAEISLCRVYKRPGVEDHPSITRSLPSSMPSSSRAVSSTSQSTDHSNKKPSHLPHHHHHHHQENAAHHHDHHQFASEKFQAFSTRQSSPHHQQAAVMEMAAAEKMSCTTYNTDQTDGSSSCSEDHHHFRPTATNTVQLGVFSKQNVYRPNMASLISPSLGLPPSLIQTQAAGLSDLVANNTTLFPVALSSTTSSPSAVSSNAAADEFHRLLSYQQAFIHQQQHQYYNNDDDHHQPQQHHPVVHFTQLPLQSQAQALSLNMLPSPLPPGFSDRLWDWNPIPEANRDYSNDPFK